MEASDIPDECVTSGFQPFPYKTFLWDWRSPSLNVGVIEVPTLFGEIGSDDLFCGGQAFLADGQLAAIGGTDIWAACAGGNLRTGHARVWVFDNAPYDPQFGLVPDWHLADDLMLRERWYATGLPTADAKLFVFGHSGYPNLPFPMLTELTREEASLDLLTYDATWDAQGEEDPNFFNTERFQGICDAENMGFLFKGYPRAHLLSTNQIMVTRGITSDLQNPTVHTAFLERDACSSALTPETDRWLRGAEGGAEPAGAGSNTAHFIVDDSNPLDVVEVVYSFLGNPSEPFEPEDDDGFGDTSPCDMQEQTNKAMKMVAPGENALWDDVSVPDLLRYRKNGQGVILLDGSILALGGLGKVFDEQLGMQVGECLQWRRPELYRPPEIFGAGASTEWEEMKCPHTHNRGHHSAGGLLPDGSVFAAGGDDSEDNLGNYSIEIYRPPYLFQGERPMIVSPNGAPTFQHGDELELSVILPGATSGQFRVALVQPGTMTHAVNFNQRYVKLWLDPVSPVAPPGQTTIRAHIPSNPAIAPPGYYLVTVVSSDGVPSAAKWIRIQS